jgi:hypothetical protein
MVLVTRWRGDCPNLRLLYCGEIAQEQGIAKTQNRGLKLKELNDTIPFNSNK